MFELLPYGISANKAKEILKLNNITIIDGKNSLQK
jgi:hypothetical protein